MERMLVGHAVALLLVLASAGLATGEDSISVAELAAKAGAEEPAGRAFGESLGQAFGRAHAATIQRCAKETKRPELSDFALLLRVDGAGVVDQAFVKPATNLATCVQGKMVGWKASIPPRPGFWVNVGVNLKRK